MRFLTECLTPKYSAKLGYYFQDTLFCWEVFKSKKEEKEKMKKKFFWFQTEFRRYKEVTSNFIVQSPIPLWSGNTF